MDILKHAKNHYCSEYSPKFNCMRNKLLLRFLSLIALFFIALPVFSQTKITGTVSSETGDKLKGASITIKGTSEGTTTDDQGNFSLTTSKTPPFDILISHTGFGDKTISYKTVGQALSVSLNEEVIENAAVIISASKRPEKVQEAPASVSVITAKALEGTPNIDPVRNLINVPGVQVQQQSAARFNIEMRGAAGLFGTSVFPILDYRSLITPGGGAFQSDASGISNIDVQRIEVVRGPGSALYGPGVTSGIVHFISKSPINYPGTTVEIMGGQLSTFGATVRHAGANKNKTFGFKINGYYRRGNEFVLDSSQGTTSASGVFRSQIAKFAKKIVQPNITAGGYVNVKDTTSEVLLTQQQLDPDGDGNMMQDDWKNHSVNATLEFRPKNNLNINVSGGINNGSAVFYNSQGEGLFQQNEYWLQTRVQAGNLFGQIYYVSNDGGSKEKPTFLYQTGNRTPAARKQLEGQLQYNFKIDKLLKSIWTTGIDLRNNKTETNHLVYGRNEDDDDYNIIGGYLQGKFLLSNKFDFVLAGRYDHFNFQSTGAFSPRAALVFKPNENHTIRTSYNKANTTNSALELNIDFPLANIIAGSFDIWHHGNKEAQTFTNPQLQWFTGLIPGMPVSAAGAPAVDGLPIGVPFAFVKQQVNTALINGLSMNPGLVPLMPAITNVLNTMVPAGKTGSLGTGFNLFDGTPLGLVTAPMTKISVDKSFELGYKGIINKKFIISFDIYNKDVSNFSRFTAISPVYKLTGYNSLPTDLGSSVGTVFSANLITALMAPPYNMSLAVATATANSITPSVAGAYTQGGTGLLNTPNPAFKGASLGQVLGGLPFHATVQTDQVPKDAGVAHIASGYRTFENITYWGADLGLGFNINQNLSCFFNYSWLSENEFTPTVTGVGDKLPYKLNIPKNKIRMGISFLPAMGWRGNASFQYDQKFNADFGQYSGNVQARSTVDLSLGHKFKNGIAIDVQATNVFDQQFRTFVNMPVIGRRILSKLSYTFGNKK